MLILRRNLKIGPRVPILGQTIGLRCKAVISDLSKLRIYFDFSSLEFRLFAMKQSAF